MFAAGTATQEAMGTLVIALRGDEKLEHEHLLPTSGKVHPPDKAYLTSKSSYPI